MCGFNPCRETESYLAKIKLGSKGSSFFIPLLRVERSRHDVIVSHVSDRVTPLSTIFFDSFGGSGTTLVAAEQTGRVAYLMELDPVYVDVIIKRWQEMTGLEAVRDDGKTYNSLI